MMDVSRETREQLTLYADLIRKWNPRINLIAPASIECLEERHFDDCTQVATLSAGSSGSWIDLGSGGGLPGLIVAIHRPDLAVTMIESDQRKSAFLRTAIRELSLKNAQVITDRIENVPSLNGNQVSARALAPLQQLMSYVFKHISVDGTAWLMKGRNWQSEVKQAQKTWAFDFVAHKSKTDPDAAILEIKRIHHV